VNAILDWPMATKAGFTAFQDPKVNQLVRHPLYPRKSTDE
jgi:phosphatidylserine decarboxylase